MPVPAANAGLLALAFLTLVFYLATMNSITTQGYKMKELDKKISGLEEEGKTLNLSLAERQSMENVLSATERLGLVPAGKIQYVKSVDTTMAKK